MICIKRPKDPKNSTSSSAKKFRLAVELDQGMARGAGVKGLFHQESITDEIER